MNDTSPAIDYELSFLESSFDQDGTDAFLHWQHAFQAALEQWHLDRAQQLLQSVKRRSLTSPQLSILRYLEGTVGVRLGNWESAAKALHRALDLQRLLRDKDGELAVLVALANLLRRMDRPLSEVVELLQQALHLADETGKPLDRAAVLNSLGLVCYTQGALTQAQSAYQDALAIVQKAKVPAQEATIQHNLGSLFWTQGDLNQAEAHFEQAFQLQQNLGDLHGQAETINSLGLILEAHGDWAAAEQHYKKSLKLLQQSGDLYGQVQVLTNLGNVSWLQNDYTQSLAHHEEALSIAEELGDVKLQGQVLTSLGDTYRMLDRHEEAEHVFLNALTHKLASGDQRSLKHTYLNLGSFYHTRNQFPQAAGAYQQALTLAQQQRDKRMEAFTLLNLGKLAALQGNVQEANLYLDAADPIALKAEYWDCLADACRVRGDLEMLQPEPDALRLVQFYAEACVHAANFNQKLLNEMVDYLVKLWTAHAEDGYAEQTIWFCESIIALWQDVGYDAPYPSLMQMFGNLRENLAKQS